MKSAEFVTVFNFKEFGADSDAPLLSPFKAPRETIMRTPRCEVLEGTGEEVPRESLDSKGRYKRVATGWGELPA